MQTQSIAVTANHIPVKKKIENILALSIITVKDLDCFDNPERRKLSSAVNKILDKLKGVERDAFLIKIAAIVPPDTRKQLWEENHLNISAAITSYIRDHGVMPAKYLIAQQTGLSRQTVTKHFNDYKTNPEHLAHMEQFKFMAPKVLSSVFRAAISGDMRAARLYLQTNSAFDQHPTNTVVNEQNNYIQINNTILSQENLKLLTAEQLRQIEDIIKKDEIVQSRL